ncbi:hypothetical protein AHF37_01009 [Paragonimus kellicotti]|nr:hypothetical protein AHF37_01009 [Paragonimus kellicotti]
MTIISLPNSVLSYPITSMPMQNNSAASVEVLTTSTILYSLQSELSTILRPDHDQLLTNEPFPRQIQPEAETLIYPVINPQGQKLLAEVSEEGAIMLTSNEMLTGEEIKRTALSLLDDFNGVNMLHEEDEDIVNRRMQHEIPKWVDSKPPKPRHMRRRKPHPLFREFFGEEKQRFYEKAKSY